MMINVEPRHCAYGVLPEKQDLWIYSQTLIQLNDQITAWGHSGVHTITDLLFRRVHCVILVQRTVLLRIFWGPV